MSKSQSSSRLSRSLPATAQHSKSKPKLSESKTARRLLAKQSLSKQQVPERVRLGDEYQSNAIAKLKLRHGATLGDSCNHRADPNWNPARDAEFLVGVQQAAAQHKKEHLDAAKLNRMKQRQQKTAQAGGAANRVPFADVGGSVDGSLTPAALLRHPKVGQCIRFYMQGPRFGTMSKPRKFPKLRSLIWALHAAVRLKKGAGLPWRRLWVTDQSVMHMLYGGNETAMRSARRANRVLRRASLTGTEQATQPVSDDSEEEEEANGEKPRKRYAEEGLYGTKRTNLTERVLYGLKANDSEQRLRKKYEQPKKRVLKFVPDEYGVPKLDTDMLVYEEFQDMLADAKREAEALHVALGTNLKARGAVKGSQTSRALLDAERASMRPPEATVEEKQENIRRSTREINHMLSTMDRASQIMKQQHENKSVVDLLELQMKAFASVNAATASGHINMDLAEKPGLVRRYPANDPLHTSPKRTDSPRKSKPRRHAKSVPSLQPRPISAQLRNRTSSNATSTS